MLHITIESFENIEEEREERKKNGKRRRGRHEKRTLRKIKTSWIASPFCTKSSMQFPISVGLVFKFVVAAVHSIEYCSHYWLSIANQTAMPSIWIRFIPIDSESRAFSSLSHSMHSVWIIEVVHDEPYIFSSFENLQHGSWTELWTFVHLNGDTF